jgi:formylglycine-generating enzyme required for sulfatase activity
VIVAAWASAHYVGVPVPWPLPTAMSKESLQAIAAVAGTGQSFRDDRVDGHLCPLCPEMVVVPAGSFMMGSPADERKRRSDEVQVAVVIARPFAVGMFAISFAEWDACVDDGGCDGMRPKDGGWGRGDRPVINLSYFDAQIYADWLGHRTGKAYRLLSEAEREYVARAGTNTPFWWGATITSSQANYNGNKTYAGESPGEDRGKTVAVSSFKPNSWGLFNVHGNVSEWTEDCWIETNSNNPGDGRANARGDCDRRTVRGGSWINGPEQLRAAARDRRAASKGYDDVGFRVAETLVP